MSLFGISWRPSQPFKASFDPKKIGFNDLVTGATLLAPGGLAGIGNIGKWGTGNLAANLGLQGGLSSLKKPKTLMALMNASQRFGGAAGSSKAGGALDMNGLQGLYQTLAGQSAMDMLTMFPQWQHLRSQAMSGLDPSRIPAEVAAQRARAMGSATQSGMAGAANLRMSGINGQGALLDALNQGTLQSNNYAAQAMSPQSVAARRQAQMGMANQQFGGLDQLLSIIQAQNGTRQVNAATQQPSLLDKLLGVAGAVAPYMKGK